METKIEIGIWGGNMASSKKYLEFILGQLSELEEITYRTMMGEFIIYSKREENFAYWRGDFIKKACPGDP